MFYPCLNFSGASLPSLKVLILPFKPIKYLIAGFISLSCFLFLVQQNLGCTNA